MLLYLYRYFRFYFSYMLVHRKKNYHNAYREFGCFLLTAELTFHSFRSHLLNNYNYLIKYTNETNNLCTEMEALASVFGPIALHSALVCSIHMHSAIVFFYSCTPIVCSVSVHDKIVIINENIVSQDWTSN
jgi:hypothetical protein